MGINVNIMNLNILLLDSYPLYSLFRYLANFPLANSKCYFTFQKDKQTDNENTK